MKSVYNEYMREILTMTRASMQKNPDVFFFFIFLLLLPLSLFFTLIPGETIYTTGSVYVSDIFFFVAIILWIIKEHKNIILSSIQLKGIISLFLAFFLWAFFSFFLVENKPIIIFRAVEILEFFMVFLYIAIRIVPSDRTISSSNASGREPFLAVTLMAFIIGGFLNSIIGIFQFFAQKSLGLRIFGESVLSVDYPGVATVILGGKEILRSYGLFPHPNILGGFLIFSLFCTIFLMKRRFVPRGTIEKEYDYGGKFITSVFWIFILSQSIALILTFSKSAILGLLVAGIFSFPHLCRMDIKKLFHVEQVKLTMTVIVFSIITLSIIFFVARNIDYRYFIKQPLLERMSYVGLSMGMIKDHPIIGVGMGQFVSEMKKYSESSMLLWQYQPVHNIYMLIFSEIGIVGLSLFILLILRIISYRQISAIWRNNTIENNDMARLIVSSEETLRLGEAVAVKKFFLPILFGFLLIGFFDHYLWDLQQGQFLLWILLGLIYPGIAMRGNDDN